MKVDKNQPSTIVKNLPFTGEVAVSSNMPVRLEIASRILAFNIRHMENSAMCLSALNAADQLIKAHNETCGVE